MIYQYGHTETDYLSRCDEKMAQIIAHYGFLERELRGSLFEGIIHSIVNQQISTKAAITVWNRVVTAVGSVTPETINALSLEQLAALGMSGRKAGYIKSAAQAVLSGQINLDALNSMSDEEVIATLSSLNGIGQWTAEMLMIFSMERPNVLSYGDLIIRKALCLLYGHETLSKKEFVQYQQQFSPYGTVASFYLWAYATEHNE